MSTILIFKDPRSFLAQSAAIANRRLIAPLRSLLEDIEQEWESASEVDVIWIYHCVFVLRAMLAAREREELERMAA